MSRIHEELHEGEHTLIFDTYGMDVREAIPLIQVPKGYTITRTSEPQLRPDGKTVVKIHIQKSR